MMTTQAVDEYCERNGLTSNARAEILRVSRECPARLITPTRSKSVVYFASTKVGQVIQCESVNCEYPFAIEMDYRSDVIAFWDQPMTLKISRTTKAGHRTGCRYTPDFLVLFDRRAVIFECKPADKLAEEERKDPSNYYFDGKRWRSPCREEAAREKGFEFEVWTPDTAGHIYRNALFLSDYLHYPPSARSASSEETRAQVAVYEAIVDEVKAELKDAGGVLRLRDLLNGGTADRPSAIYWAIVNGHLFVDQSRSIIAHTSACMVALNLPTAIAAASDAGPQRQLTIEIRPGDIAELHGSTVKCIACTAGNSVWKIAGQPNVELTSKDVSDLIQSKSLKLSDAQEKLIQSGLGDFTAVELDRANRKLAWLDLIERGECTAKELGVTERTIRNWKARVRQAVLGGTSKILALVDRHRDKGNRTRRLPTLVVRFVRAMLYRHYYSPVAKSVVAVAEMSAGLMQERKAAGKPTIDLPCREYFYRTAQSLRSIKAIKRRDGHKQAHSNPDPDSVETLVPHLGDRAWEVGYVDHTLLDIRIVSTADALEMPRPWLSILVDGYSRKVLAFWLSVSQPSTTTLMHLIRSCVLTHGRLPDRISSDGGSEFFSNYWQLTLPRFGVTQVARQTSTPKKGGVVERPFGRITFDISSRWGNTKALRDVRKMCREKNPIHYAAWTLDTLDPYLTVLLGNGYGDTLHCGIGATPNSRFQRSIEDQGDRAFRTIAFDAEFQALTMPFAVAKKMERKFLPGKPFRFEGADYYPAVRDPTLKPDDVLVRVDPENAARLILDSERNGQIEVITKNTLIRELRETRLKFAIEERKGISMMTKQAKRQLSESRCQLEHEASVAEQKAHKELTSMATAVREKTAGQDMSWLDGPTESLANWECK